MKRRNKNLSLALAVLAILNTAGAISAGALPAALAAGDFSATENPSAGLLKGSGGGNVGPGIRPGTPVGSPVPPHRDLAPSLKRRSLNDPDAMRTDNTNRIDQNARNSPHN